MPAYDYRYQRANRSFGVAALAVIGLGMAAGGAALLVGLVLDLQAFPATPIPTTIAAATAMPQAMGELGRGRRWRGGLRSTAGQGNRQEASQAPRSEYVPLSQVGVAMPLSTGDSAIQLFTTPMLVFHLVAFGPLFFATQLVASVAGHH